MEKIKRLFRKILRTILIWSTITSLFLIQANADLIETINNPPNILLGTMYPQNDQQHYTIEPFPFDYGTIRENLTMGDNSTNTSSTVLGLWQSRFYPNTFYKFSINIEILNNTTGEELETGTVIKNQIQWLNILEDELFHEIDALKVKQMQTTSIPLQAQLNDDYYTMFYDATSNMLSAIIYLPQSYFDLYPQKQQHVYIMMALGYPAQMSMNQFSISSYTGTNAEGIYTEILNQISSKLENLASSGGGLTEEQVSNAVKSALQEHDSELNKEANLEIGEAKDKIQGALEKFDSAEYDIEVAFDSILQALRYEGTDSKLIFPSVRNPLANNVVLWEEQEVDLAMMYNTLPQILRSAISVVGSVIIYLCVFREVIDVIKRIVLMNGGDDIDD